MHCWSLQTSSVKSQSHWARYAALKTKKLFYLYNGVFWTTVLLHLIKNFIWFTPRRVWPTGHPIGFFWLFSRLSVRTYTVPYHNAIRPHLPRWITKLEDVKLGLLAWDATKHSWLRPWDFSVFKFVCTLLWYGYQQKQLRIFLGMAVNLKRYRSGWIKLRRWVSHIFQRIIHSRISLSRWMQLWDICQTFQEWDGKYRALVLSYGGGWSCQFWLTMVAIWRR